MRSGGSEGATSSKTCIKSSDKPENNSAASASAARHESTRPKRTLATLDSACGYAALTLTPPRCEVLTVELKTNLLAPARSGTIKAHGEVLRAGGTLTVCQGDAFEFEEGEETHVATMLATMITSEENF